MNTNLTLSEIVTIAVVILIVFGPQRLPEMARRAGEMLAKVRTAANTLRSEFTQEFEEAAKPLKDIEAELKATKDELKGVKQEMQASLPDLRSPVPPPAATDEPAVTDGSAATDEPAVDEASAADEAETGA